MGGPPGADDPTVRMPPPSASARDPGEIARGALVGRYRILGLLGQGGMGSVYEAYDPQLDRRLALKLVRAGMISDRYLRARMAREARTMAKLSHPNVVTVYDAGPFGDDFFIAMELVSGVTLREWMRGDRTEAEILRLFCAAGRGLAAAHAAGIVHRDFKPDNVLVDREGRVAVTDFGVAAPPPRTPPPEIDGSVPTSARAVTETGALMGTPRYMSPEQCAGDKLDGRSDQFAFAVVLYEALFHVRPFEGDTIGELLRAVREGRTRAPPPDSNVPRHVTQAVMRALSTDPASRFASLTDMIAALETDRETAPLPSPRESRVIVAAAAALMLIMAVGVGLAIKLRKPKASLTVAASAVAELPSRRPGGRTPVLIAPLDDRVGDARFPDALEATIAEPLYASPRFDPYTADQFVGLEADLHVPPDPTGMGLARALVTRDGGRAMVVRGSIARAPSGFHLRVQAEDAGTGQFVFDAERDAADADDALPKALGLGQALRAILGDPQSDTGSDRVTISGSLEAVHAWAAGTRFVRGGETALGVAALRRAVSTDPGFTLAHAGLSIALFDIGDTLGAEEEDRIALEQKDNLGDRRRLRLLADYYDNVGRYAESIAAFEQLLSAWPGDSPTETSMAATAIESEQWPLAMELSRRAVRDHPGMVVARQNLVLAELAGGALDDAVRDGEATLAAFPHPPVYTFAHLASAETLLGRRAAALATLDRLAQLDPDAASQGRADLALYEGRLTDAEALLEAQLRAATAHDAATFDLQFEYIALAEIHLRRGERSKAKAETDLCLGPGSAGNGPEGYLVARLLVETGRDEAAASMTRGWEDRGIDLRMYAALVRGDALLAHGKRRDAIAAYRDAGRVMDQWTVHERLGQAYLAEGAWADASRELSLCVARRSEAAKIDTPSLRLVPPLYFALARAKEGARDPGARAAYEAFLALEPEAQGDPLAVEAKRRLAALGE
jgi:serine/threonine protein kinase/tetratricopeptide (TPR) repeat protein